MVAVIKTGTSLHRAFNYNEQKVKEGVAACIAAVNYPKDVAQLTLSQKLNRLLHQAALNENVTRNSVHISLNFDPSEKHFISAINANCGGLYAKDWLWRSALSWCTSTMMQGTRTSIS